MLNNGPEPHQPTALALWRLSELPGHLNRLRLDALVFWTVLGSFSCPVSGDTGWVISDVGLRLDRVRLSRDEPSVYTDPLVSIALRSH
jgi:hypothetical protein